MGLQGCNSPRPSLTRRPTYREWLLQEASNRISWSIRTRILTALCSKCLKVTAFVGDSRGNGKGKGSPLSTTIDIPSIIEDLVGAQLLWSHRLLPLFQHSCTTSTTTEAGGRYVIRSPNYRPYSQFSSKSPKSLDERKEEKAWFGSVTLGTILMTPPSSF